MGGGAAMRAATKVAGFGIGSAAAVHGGLRGSAPPAEQVVQKSSIPVSATLSSSSGNRTGGEVAAVKPSVWEIEGWEFAGVVEEAGEPLPRVVFSGAPSFDEAMEATSELKDALDKVYLSSPKYSDLSGLSLVAKPESENQFGLVAETDRSHSVPNQVLKAFRLLSTSTEVQNVVASVASDPNVWKAIMHNPVLQEFRESNKTGVEFEEPAILEKVEGSSTETMFQKSVKWVKGVCNKIKVTAVDLVTSLESKFNNIFANVFDSNGDEKSDFPGKIAGASFLGLVTMVVMVVLLKRA